MADSYTKTLVIDFDKRRFDNSISDFKNTFEQFKDDIEESNINIFDTEEFDELQKQYAEVRKKKLQMAELQEAINKLDEIDTDLARKKSAELQAQLDLLSDHKVDEDDEGQGGLKQKWSQFKNSKFYENIEDKRNELIKKALDGITDIISDGFKQMQETTKYQLGGVFGSMSAKETALTYGFNSSQTYGFEKALSALGLSEDDLFSGLMSSEQMSAFQNMMESYTSYYEEMESSGLIESMSNYQLEMLKFKTELANDVGLFFADNKDLIKSSLKVGAAALEGILTIVGNIAKLFNFSVGSSSEQGRSVRNRVTVNQTFNTSTANNQQQLTNVGSQTYMAVIKALGGNY